MVALFCFRCCSCQNPVISVNFKTHPRRARKEKTRARRAIKTKKLNSKTQNLSLSPRACMCARARVKKKITLKKRTKLSPHPPCSIDRCVRESPNRTIFSRRDVNPISVLLFLCFFLRKTSGGEILSPKAKNHKREGQKAERPEGGQKKVLRNMILYYQSNKNTT